MEAVKHRSESPFSRSKAKSHFSGASENGSMDIEQIKAKKKIHKNKCQTQQNGKEKENLTNNEKDYLEGEKTSSTEMGDNSDSNNSEYENGINSGEYSESRNGEEKLQEQMEENKENDSLVNVCDIAEEYISNESGNKTMESGAAEECKSTKDDINADIIDDSPKQCSSLKTSETENNAKKDSLPSSNDDSLPDSNTAYENSEEQPIKVEDDTLNGDTDITQDLEPNVEGVESSQISINESEGNSRNEPTNVIKDHIQASPDTATKDDSSFSNKITNFFGILSHSHEQKQDSEVSSSRKTDGVLSHPYLSKVSGRRGIKDRLNSSATIFRSKEMGMKTPENSGISLDDSFRVRTNPTHLNSLDLTENSTLRKFRGKRCLNTGDEPEEDLYFNTMKKRKIDEKTQEPGLWGSILWRSPFKKKPFGDEDQLKLATNESKLLRLLSPFWFWKKTTGQKGK